MPEIRTVFFDVGGVLLTNGWDHEARVAVADHFGLDYEEFRDRHEILGHDFETGRLDIETYLERTVFHTPRPFSREEFIEAMKSRSEALPGALELVAEIGQAGRVSLATLNNESRELNEFRISKFGLRNLFALFLSSCYLGVKKPEAEIYDTAMQITQTAPGEGMFIDDRELNVECARDEGIVGIHYEGVAALRRTLVQHGVLDDR